MHPRLEAEGALDAAGRPDLIGTDQGDHDTARSRTSRPTRPVEVILVVGGKVEVDDARHPVDMDAAGSDVSGDERLHLSGLEGPERTVALVLIAAAMNGGGVHARTVELSRHPVRSMAGPREDDARSGITDDLGGDAETLGGVEPPEVVDGIRDLLLARHLVTDRVPLVTTGQLGDRPVEGRREENGLAVGSNLVEKSTNLRKETHVRHPVCLVDDDHLDPPQVDGALIDEVGETPGGGNDEVDTLGECPPLGFVPDAAVDGREPPLLRLGEWGELTGDLLGELAGGGQDEGQRPTGLGSTEPSDEGEAEGERLSRPGGGTAENVATGKGVGDGGGLDREGLDDTPTVEDGGERRGYAEFDEAGH